MSNQPTTQETPSSPERDADIDDDQKLFNAFYRGDENLGPAPVAMIPFKYEGPDAIKDASPEITLATRLRGSRIAEGLRAIRRQFVQSFDTISTRLEEDWVPKVAGRIRHLGASVLSIVPENNPAKAQFHDGSGGFEILTEEFATGLTDSDY